MKSILALAVALSLGSTGMASAGMQGLGAKPTANKPEYKEPNPGPYGYRLMEMMRMQIRTSPGTKLRSTGI